MTRPFINSREALLIVIQGRDGQYIENSAYLGTIVASASDVIIDGNEVLFLRLELETNTSEDVTEEVAKAWLAEHPDYDRDTCPEFVGAYLDSLTPQSFTEDADSAADRANDYARDLETAE